MKASELRIGNLVKWDYSGILEVVLISGEDLYLDLINPTFEKPISGRYDLESVKPIPLTEEWLIRLGFEKKPMYGKHNEYFFIKNKLYYCEHDFYSFVYSNNSLEIKEPKYVHQLQNLYFSLTGEELTMTQQ